MTCESCREILLEAELAELRGEGTTAFAQHIRDCPSCRALAQQVLEDIDALSTALATQRSAVPIAQAVAGATGEAARRRKRRTMWRAVGPVLAAAGLAGLLVSQRSPREAGVRPLPAERHVPGFVPDVDAPSNRDFIVIGSDDPDIVIIWFF